MRVVAVGRARRLLFSVAIIGCWASSVSAQEPKRRVEIAPGVSIVRFEDFDSYLESVRRQSPSTIRLHSWYDPGPALEVTINLSDAVALEAMTTLLPRFASVNGFPSKGGGKGLVEGGMAMSHSVGKIGLLAVGHGGAISLTQAPQIAVGGAGSPGLIVQVGANRTYATAYAGAGVRVPVFLRASVRADVGDFITWYRPEPSATNPSFARHNLRLGIGMAFSIGPTLRKD